MYFFIQVNENSVLQVQIQTNIQEIGQTKALELRGVFLNQIKSFRLLRR
jgi:hypothetical protein